MKRDRWVYSLNWSIYSKETLKAEIILSNIGLSRIHPKSAAKDECYLEMIINLIFILFRQNDIVSLYR